MPDFSLIFDAILMFFMTPIHLMLMPVDYLLRQIPGIDIIPKSIEAIVSYISSIPATLVSLSGLSPIIFNAIISTLLLYFAAIPTINGIKKLLNWIRG